jgi:DNA polymerase-3 subunit gamma/tau
MSYQVLARKYRPKSFQTLVGQEHVVRALTHALEQQRLHHAYLFTGTRGVGKTTLSRILAKSLNCEQGITANPCGVCDACVAIDAGRFIDYIEMDAASNRGVDEMAQLLEQAVYAPNNARFKVYMIDEVHMLTNHAFNAMLKTLEEPPAHIKFILATTDPQKIPVTVLSRCLQFNLKQMPVPAIVGHLDNILNQEHITFDVPALRLLAQGAQGSMRDALSLTDQAIAYAAGTVSLSAVQGMLGALDQTYLIQILDALVAQDGSALLAVADQMQTRSLSYKAALQDLATLLHQISIAQLVPAAIADDMPDRAEIVRLAASFDAEQIQLFYQIAVHGRNELALAPDEYAGFSMTLLRMLAFRPVTDEPAPLLSATTSPGSAVRAASAVQAAPRTMPAARPAVVAQARAAAVVPKPDELVIESPAPAKSATPAKLSPAMAALEAMAGRRNKVKTAGPATEDNRDDINFAASSASAEKKTELNPADDVANVSAIAANQAMPAAVIEVNGVWLQSGAAWDGDWPQMAASLPLRGVAQQLAQQSELIRCDASPQGIVLGLRVPLETLLASDSVEKLAAMLADKFTVPVKLTTEIGVVKRTANAAAIVERAVRQDVAEVAIKGDQIVQGLMRVFGATIVPGSVKPVN